MKLKFKRTILSLALTAVIGLLAVACGKSQEWYDKNQNFSDVEGRWQYQQDVEGKPQTIRLDINEDGTGNMLMMIGVRTIVDDKVKLGRSKENLSVLFGGLHEAHFHIKDGKVYTAEWEAFEKR